MQEIKQERKKERKEERERKERGENGKKDQERKERCPGLRRARKDVAASVAHTEAEKIWEGVFWSKSLRKLWFPCGSERCKVGENIAPRDSLGWRLGSVKCASDIIDFPVESHRMLKNSQEFSGNLRDFPGIS